MNHWFLHLFSQDWRPEHGGLLVDAKEGAEKAKAVVPEWLGFETTGVVRGSMVITHRKMAI
jgi:hypothetical protein